MTTDIDFTHDLSASSWVESANGHCDFPIQNLPLGVFSSESGPPRCGVAIGDSILDIAAVAAFLPEPLRRLASLAQDHTLNALLAEGNHALSDLRRALFRLLGDEADRAAVEPCLHPASACAMHLPAHIGDYTDFYTGIHHATNVGRLFRPENPLMPNYKHIPIGYHGRSSSIRLSGEEVRRPKGQTKAPDRDVPIFGPCCKLDYELEMGLWIGRGNVLGEPIPITEAGDHIAGLSLLNDWSARDVQAWEYQPLGPFLAKNFHSTISPWIITSAALAPYRIAQAARPAGDPVPMPYLLDPEDQRRGAFNICMEVHLRTAEMRAAGLSPYRLSSGTMGAMYWTAAQLVAHHSSNGCELKPGDFFGTGTLSGEVANSRGSLIELSDNGNTPLLISNGERRRFLEDGDEVIMTAYAEAHGFARIGFGCCSGTVVA